MGVHRGGVTFMICIRLAPTDDLCITSLYYFCIVLHAFDGLFYDKGWEREGKSRNYCARMLS
jgi:hypothetical protein